MNVSDWPALNAPIAPRTDSVAVVQLDLRAELEQIAQLREVLSPDEIARADRYKFDELRRRFVVCRATLRRLLGEYSKSPPEALVFAYGPHGKPALSGQRDDVTRIEFSVSHSADVALIALAMGRRVGVDVEQHDASVKIHRLAARFFSPRETAELMGLPDEMQRSGFYRGWTSKEAYLKATGFGLSFSLSKFTVSLDPCRPAALVEVIEQADEPSRWRMHSLEMHDGFSAALLVEARADEVVSVQRWSIDPRRIGS
jgi:4'-phosphopantetheinyl transferase